MLGLRRAVSLRGAVPGVPAKGVGSEESSGPETDDWSEEGCDPEMDGRPAEDGGLRRHWAISAEAAVCGFFRLRRRYPTPQTLPFTCLQGRQKLRLTRAPARAPALVGCGLGRPVDDAEHACG